MNNKIISYLGFALKKGSIILGLDDILKTKKHTQLIIYSKELKENSLNKIKNFANDKQIFIFATDEELFTKLSLVGVKVLSVTDKSLANAIINQIKDIK